MPQPGSTEHVRKGVASRRTHSVRTGTGFDARANDRGWDLPAIPYGCGERQPPHTFCRSCTIAAHLKETLGRSSGAAFASTKLRPLNVFSPESPTRRS